MEATGSSTATKTLTQRMVLRWHHLMTAEGLSLSDAFEQIRWEFRDMITNFQEFLTKARSEAQDRHSKLSIAKVKRDALQYGAQHTGRCGGEVRSVVLSCALL